MADSVISVRGGHNVVVSGEGASGTLHIGYTPEQIVPLLQAAGVAAQTRITDLAAQLTTSRDVTIGFLRILREDEVPTEQLATKLELIANRYLSMMQRLASLDTQNATAQAYIGQSQQVLGQASSARDYDGADDFLRLAEDAQGDSIDRPDVPERQSNDVARLRRDKAATRAERAQLSLTRLDYLQAAEHYRAAAYLLAPEDSVLRRTYLLQSASALDNYGDEKGDNSVLLQAIERFRELQRETPRAVRSLDWAVVEFNTATSLLKLGERESGTAHLEESAAAFHNALDEFTRERVPLYWAATQDSLGNTLQTLGDREKGTGRFKEAVVSYRNALEEYTRARVPLDWAKTQNNLGVALLSLGRRDGSTAHLEEGVLAYRSALEERTRERVPQDWAVTQNNLGGALLTLGERESGNARLEEAAAVFRDALQERSRKRVPLSWAATQNNLGRALAMLGERESGTDRLEEAVTAYRNALEERTRERVPLGWAQTQDNLGDALRTLGERESGTVRLKEARDALTAAWKVYREAGMTHYENNFEVRLAAINAIIVSRTTRKSWWQRS